MTRLFIFLISYLSCCALNAASVTWTGTSNVYLNDPANWLPDIPDATTDAYFDTTSPIRHDLSMTGTGNTVFARSVNISGYDYTFAMSLGNKLFVGARGVTIASPHLGTFYVTGTGNYTFANCSLSTAQFSSSGGNGSIVLTDVSGANAQVSLSGGLALAVNGNVSLGYLNSSSSSDSIVLASGGSILTVGNLNNNAIIVGSISETTSASGQLTKVGSGSLSLTNTTNSYTGGTNINGGTLQISAAGNMPSIGAITFNGGDVLDTMTGGFPTPLLIPNDMHLITNGKIKVDTNTTTLSGSISLAGSLTKTGTGTLVLSGSNSYSGGTNINGGTLQVPAANVIPSGTITFTGPSTLALDTGLGGFAIPNAITLTANGSVDVNTGNAGILSGQITGVGFSLTKTGNGTLALSNNTNNYSGGTNINGGTLQVSAANVIPNTGTITFTGPSTLDTLAGGFAIPNAITLTANGTVNVNSDTTTLNGAIDGAGSLTKTGNGTLSLFGTNTYFGSTTISNGRLNANSTIHSPAAGVVVNSGATLGGTGTITANTVTINGTLNPGNSIGTLNVVGPVTLNSSSNYLVEFDAANCDLLNVAGSVTIQPGASVTLQDDQFIANPTVYPIITATSPISGTFTTLNNSYLFLTAQLSYSVADQVLLILNRKSFASGLPSNAPFNALSVGLALDQVNPFSGSDLGNIVSDLMLATSQNELIHDLLQMQPSQLKALGVSATNTTMQMHAMIANHADSYFKTPCSLSDRKKWEVWIDALGNFSHQSQLRGEYGFHDKTGSFLIGIDACPIKNLCIGIATAYTFTHLEWNRNPSKADIQNGYGILYASWYCSHFFVTSSLTGSYEHTNANRSIVLYTSDLSRTANSSFSGVQGSGFFEIGGIFRQNKFQFMPFASLHYCYLHQDHFNEKGAMGLNLQVKEANADLLRSEAGLKVSYCRRTKDREWIPKLGVSVIEDSRFKGKYGHAEFAENQGVFFTVKGLRPQHMLISPKASVQLKKGEHLSWILSYDGLFGGKFHDNRTDFSMNYSF